MMIKQRWSAGRELALQMFILHIYIYKGTEVFMVCTLSQSILDRKKLNTENFRGNLDIW